MRHRPLTCQVCKRLLYANRGFINQHIQAGELCPGSGLKPLEAKGKYATVRWNARKREFCEVPFVAKVIEARERKLAEAQERKRAAQRLKELIAALDPERHSALVERMMAEVTNH